MKKLVFAVAAATLLGAALWTANAQQAAAPAAGGSQIPPATKGLADITSDADGTLHFGARTVPPNMSASPEFRAAFVETIKERLAAAKVPPASRAQSQARQDAFARKAMQLYPDVRRAEMTIAGVPVVDWTPTDISPRNAHRIALEFEIDPEGVQLAGIGKMEVISVHYGREAGYGYANAVGIKDIVKVYREMLKTHKGDQIALFGISGGCQQAAITTLYLHYLGLPMPGALGLLPALTIAGDSPVLMEGADPELSLWDGGVQAGPGLAAGIPAPPPPPPTPGIIRGRIQDADAIIPPGFPPSFLISGTRDKVLSGTVRLQQKLRRAGVIVDMDIFDGLWHAFEQHAEIPESRYAFVDMWHFFDAHMGT